MTRFEMFDAIRSYKSNLLAHSNNFKYYNKIDLGNGNTRYFYTKAEWDAYLEGKKRSEYEAEQKKKKEAENRSGMSDYTKWKKNEDKKKKIEEQKKESIEKNKAASEHEGDRFKKPTKSLVEQSIFNREAAINKAQKNISNKSKDIANKLYEHKDEIVEKADVYLKLADDKLSSFLDKFVGDFPPEFKDKVKKILNEIKDYAEDIAKKINDTGSEQIDNIVGLIDKITDKLQDKIDEYSKELSDMYQNFKDKINPVFKDKDGNINWKLFLPIAAGLGTIGFIIENPEMCFDIFSKIYDTGKKAFNFIDAKTDGKFSAAVKQIPEKIDNYLMYKQLEDKGFGTFTTLNSEGERVTYLDKVYNDYLNMEGGGYATMAANILFRK